MDLRGTHFVKLDGKGRVVIPSRYRDKLEATKDGLVVTGHPDGFLLLMLTREYAKLEKKVSKYPETSKEATYYKQTLIGKADDAITFDTAGRISLSPDLREHANLQNQVAVVGMRDHIRIWSKEALDRLAKKVRHKNMEDLGNVPHGWDDFRI